MINAIKIVLFLLCLATAKAGTIDPNIPDSKYLEYRKKFDCVVKLCGSYQDGNVFCASAVVVSKRQILTAAHVVKCHKTCYVRIKEKKIVIKRIIAHKDFETEFGIADIATGFSEEDMEVNAYPELYTETDEKGKPCSMSGYGLTGNFNTGIYLSDNKKRAGSNRIDSFHKDLLICTPSKRTDKDYTVLEYMIGSGDSGGGLFIDGKLAGINSCVMAVGRSPMSKYGEESGHTRISKFIDWIKENSE
jgi:hypothetical protein